MSRTRNTDPYFIQSDDLCRPGKFHHNHAEGLCDLGPHNGRIALQKYQSAKKTQLKSQLPRCSHTLFYYGGCNSFGRHTKSMRKHLERQVRRRVNDSLHSMEIEGIGCESEIVPVRAMRRQIAWLLN